MPPKFPYLIAIDKHCISLCLLSQPAGRRSLQAQSVLDGKASILRFHLLKFLSLQEGHGREIQSKLINGPL